MLATIWAGTYSVAIFVTRRRAVFFVVVKKRCPPQILSFYFCPCSVSWVVPWRKDLT
jgi:hypothetical protein